MSEGQNYYGDTTGGNKGEYTHTHIYIYIYMLDFCMLMYRTNVTQLNKDTELTFQYFKSIKCTTNVKWRLQYKCTAYSCY